MSDCPVLIPTAEGAVGGVVSSPSGQPAAAALLLAGWGRPARSGVNSFWTRFARTLAERGILTLRVDYSREGETSPIGEGGGGQAWKRELDLRLLEQVLPWFRERAGGLPLSLAGICSGARLTIELAGREPDGIAATFLVVPHVRELPGDEEQSAPSAGGLAPVDPLVVDCMQAILTHRPSWILVGECDDQDVAGLEAQLGSTPMPLEVETVPGVALHMLDQPALQGQVGSRLLAAFDRMLLA